MQVLSRRLYNGGFNHLKRVHSLLYRAPGIVIDDPQASARKHFAATRAATLQSNEQPGDAHAHGLAHCHHTAADTMAAHLDFAAANDQYVAEFSEKDLGGLPLPPAKKLAIVTCMDARLNPYAHLGLKEGDAHIIRNAGGAAKEALRSIIISQRYLGTREVAVFHHTGCGMLTFTTPQLRSHLKEHARPGTDPNLIDNFDFLEFQNLEASVTEDVKFLQDHPLLLPETKITGWVYDVQTGKVRQIA